MLRSSHFQTDTENSNELAESLPHSAHTGHPAFAETNIALGAHEQDAFDYTWAYMA